MQAKGQTTNRETSLREEKHAYDNNTPLSTFRLTCRSTPFSFQEPFWKESPAQSIVNEGRRVEGTWPKKSMSSLLYLFSFIYQSIQRATRASFSAFWVRPVENIMERNTWHDEGQSHQEVEQLDDSAYQSQKGALTARVLANLGLKEERGTRENGRAREPIHKLIEALQCSDSSIRIASVHALMKRRAEVSEHIHLYLQVEFARMALLERNCQHRIVAIRAIGIWGGSRSISTLEICLQHPYEYIRAAAAQAIAEIGIRADLGGRLNDTIVILLFASLDKHWVVRTAVIRAMRTLGQHNVGRQEFINAVVLALDDEECAVRVAAVRALYELKGKEALPRLELIAKRDFEFIVRDAAQDILQAAVFLPSGRLIQ